MSYNRTEKIKFFSASDFCGISKATAAADFPMDKKI